MENALQTLEQVAKYVRSKNAGPFWVTVDIFCGDVAAYDRIRSAPSLSAEAVARVYGVPAESVRVFENAPLKVVKISFPRRVAQGSTRDADSHAGQYFVSLLKAPVA
jgi:hypothetical protein